MGDSLVDSLRILWSVWVMKRREPLGPIVVQLFSKSNEPPRAPVRRGGRVKSKRPRPETRHIAQCTLLLLMCFFLFAVYRRAVTAGGIWTPAAAETPWRSPISDEYTMNTSKAIDDARTIAAIALVARTWRPPKLKWHQLSAQYRSNKFRSANCECCEYSSFEDADVVFAHPHKTRLVRHHATQRWVAQFWESEANYPPLNPLRDYDATKSYRSDSTFPCFNMITHTFKPHALMPIVPYEDKLTEEMMSTWLTNCGAGGRAKLLNSLTKITKASYGRCGKDHSEKEHTKFNTELDRSSQARGIQKMIHSANYLFLFAAENSISPYYHTEKLFHGLMAGTIPVYYGADTVDEFVPDHSIIKVSDWGAGLEDYLLRVAGNRTLYESYFEWRKHPLPKHLSSKLGPCPTVCEIGKRLWRTHVDSGVTPKVVSHGIHPNQAFTQRGFRLDVPRNVRFRRPLADQAQDGGGHDGRWVGAAALKRGPTQNYTRSGVTAIVARKDEHNPFFMLSLVYNVWCAARHVDRVVFLDECLPTEMDDLWGIVFPGIQTICIAELAGQSRVYERALVGMSETNGDLMRHLNDDAWVEPRNARLAEFVSQMRGNARGSRRIIVSRRHTSKRRLDRIWKNEAEIAEAIGATPVVFEGLDMKEQIRVSAETSLMIGMHGAGLVHALWMREGSTLVEIFPKKQRRWGYRNIANMLGLRYIEYRGGRDTREGKVVPVIPFKRILGHRVIDAVHINHEVDIYALRHAEYQGIVNEFHVFEGSVTHRGILKNTTIRGDLPPGVHYHRIPKPSNYKSCVGGNRKCERYERGYVSETMAKIVGPTDVFITSDADEVASAECLRDAVQIKNDCVSLNTPVWKYSFNWKDTKASGWRTLKVCSGVDTKTIILKHRYGLDGYAHTSRYTTHPGICGWHLSTFGTIQEIQRKALSIPDGVGRYHDDGDTLRRVDLGISLFSETRRYTREQPTMLPRIAAQRPNWFRERFLRWPRTHENIPPLVMECGDLRCAPPGRTAWNEPCALAPDIFVRPRIPQGNERVQASFRRDIFDSLTDIFKNKIVVNFGAQFFPGMSPWYDIASALLLKRGWNSFLFDTKSGLSTLRQAVKREQLSSHAHFHPILLTSKNAPEYLRSHHVPLNLDFLKVDIDSFDCDLARSLLQDGFRPTVLQIENAPQWPRGVVIEYSALGSKGPTGGCSCDGIVALGIEFGYSVLTAFDIDVTLIRDDIWTTHKLGTIFKKRTGCSHSCGAAYCRAGNAICGRWLAMYKRGEHDALVRAAAKRAASNSRAVARVSSMHSDLCLSVQNGKISRCRVNAKNAPLVKDRHGNLVTIPICKSNGKKKFCWEPTMRSFLNKDVHVWPSMAEYVHFWNNVKSDTLTATGEEIIHFRCGDGPFNQNPKRSDQMYQLPCPEDIAHLVRHANLTRAQMIVGGRGGHEHECDILAQYYTERLTELTGITVTLRERQSPSVDFASLRSASKVVSVVASTFTMVSRLGRLDTLFMPLTANFASTVPWFPFKMQPCPADRLPAGARSGYLRLSPVHHTRVI